MDTNIAGVLIDNGIASREVRVRDLFGCKVIEVNRNHATLSIAIPRTPAAIDTLGRQIMWEISYLDDSLDIEREGGTSPDVPDLRFILRRFAILADG